MSETNRSTRRTLLQSLLASLFALFFARLPALPHVSAANPPQGNPPSHPEPPDDVQIGLHDAAGYSVTSISSYDAHNRRTSYQMMAVSR